ncbi:MAG: Maf family protein [Terriglobia bacterium]
MKRIILASRSPRRREVLRTAGFAFEVIAGAGEEPYRQGEEPARYAERMARRKAEAVATNLAARDDAVVLGADTVVVLGGEVLGKPRSPEDACAMLERLAGRAHEVITGVALVAPGSARASVAHERTQVFFRVLTRTEIEAYVATGEPLDKAGAYAIQGLGARLVSRIEGCYFNVMGLPVALVDRLLRELAGGEPVPFS